jgi:hypothetical protein
MRSGLKKVPNISNNGNKPVGNERLLFPEKLNQTNQKAIQVKGGESFSNPSTSSSSFPREPSNFSSRSESCPSVTSRSKLFTLVDLLEILERRGSGSEPSAQRLFNRGATAQGSGSGKPVTRGTRATVLPNKTEVGSRPSRIPNKHIFVLKIYLSCRFCFLLFCYEAK